MNRLAGSLSPYLLQHADQPVHWWPWSPEALAEAAQGRRPILLSVGYATCHWCHVMAHESFDDPGIAARMNRDFVCIKVDREERPDVDALYMEALQAITGRGGWPMTLFLTPEGVPFYAGTYFPPRAGHGIVGFPDLLGALAEAWRGRRAELEAGAGRVLAALRAGEARSLRGPLPGRPALANAVTTALAVADRRHGGFGGAPKFPQAPLLGLLAAWAEAGEQGSAPAREGLLAALEAMAAGGLMDQLGGGFHRYCVDDSWTVPHFEKMLYDNALLLSLYLAGERLGGSPRCRAAAEGIVAWLMREMRHSAGAFFAAQDADQEGEEGLSYLWRPEEVTAVLGAGEGAWAAEQLGVTHAGNAEAGRSVPTRRGPALESAAAARLDDAIRRLLEARRARPAPGTDDKVIVSWNALCALALDEAARQWDRPQLRQMAEDVVRFLLVQLRLPDGSLAHAWRDGRAAVPAFLDDLGALAWVCLRLAASEPTGSWAQAGRDLCEQMLAEHVDAEGALIYRTGPRHEELFLRLGDLLDQATPSGASLAAAALLERQRLLGEAEAHPALLATLRAVGKVAQEHPGAVAGLLTVALRLDAKG